MKVERFLELCPSDFFAGVPDSQLKALCDELMEKYGTGKQHHIVANEGNAVALAAGYHLASGKVPMVYLQNSGEGNAMNPLVSLASERVYGIPLLLVIGYRGEPGVKDEPQHLFQGEITLDFLKLLQIPYFVLEKESKEEEFKKALELVYTMDKTALVEEVLSGTEISVPVIDGKVFPTVKIEAVAGDYFDYDSKYSEGGAREFVFEFPEEIQNEIDKFSYDSYYAVKCEGFARIDFMVVNEETPYFMEVNTSPGMTAASLLPKSTASKGYSYSETLDLLIESSLKVER